MKEASASDAHFTHSNTLVIDSIFLYQVAIGYLLNNPTDTKRATKAFDLVYKLAKSDNLWEKRIATISTFTFIRHNQFADSLEISKILLNDKHDLIHKAVGWMLREVGNRNLETEEKFLKRHYKNMPHTMLRYAIEKFEEGKRKGYLKK